MKNRSLILLHLAAGLSALAACKTLIEEQPEDTPAEPPIDGTKPEPIVDAGTDASPVPTPAAGQWHANGWGLYADDEGLVESSIVTPLYRRLPQSVKAKIGYLFVCSESFFSASYPTPLAQLFAQKHLSSRRVTPIMPDFSKNWNVARYTVDNVNPEKPNYDVPPWAQTVTTWHEVEIRFDAYSMDWDPAKDHAYCVDFWKAIARRELEAQGYKPERYGV